MYNQYPFNYQAPATYPVSYYPMPETKAEFIRRYCIEMAKTRKGLLDVKVDAEAARIIWEESIR